MKSLEKYEYKIFDLCEKLHMSATGSGDPIYGEEQGNMMATLMKRLCNWAPSKHTTVYDNAVKLLILITLNEQIIRFAPDTVPVNES